MKRTIIHDFLVSTLVIALLIFLKIPYFNILLALIIVLIYSHKKKGIKTELGFSKPESWIKTIVTASLLALGIILLSYFILLPQIQILTGYQLDLGMFKQLGDNTSLLILSLVLGWVVGGFIEETIFRGFILSKFINHLPNKIGTLLGIIISSAIFGYLHKYQGPSGQVLTGLIGTMFAIIFVLNKRNIWLNIFTHGFVNTFGFILLYFNLINIS